jgi:hypothetical protein
MALWDAPMTPMLALESEGMILVRTGGLRAGSSPISCTLVTGRGLDTGCDPVQRTRRSEDTVMGPEAF